MPMAIRAGSPTGGSLGDQVGRLLTWNTVGAVVGGIVGASIGAAAEPPAEVRTYVMAEPAPTVAASVKDSFKPINERVTAMVERVQATR